MANTIPNVEPKLDGLSNYNTWKLIMKMTLKGMDLWDCVERETGLQGAPIPLDAKKDQRALATICLNIKVHCHMHIQSVETAEAAWKSLANAFEDCGPQRRVGLMRKLMRINYDDYPGMQEYIADIMDISQRLRDIGKPLDDDLLATIMLGGLPPRFESFELGLEGSGRNLSSDWLKNKLLQYAMKLETSGSQTEATAFATRKRGGGAGSFKERRCYHCNDPGHLKPQCPHLKKKPQESTYQKKTQESTSQGQQTSSQKETGNKTQQSHSNKKWTFLTALHTKSTGSHEDWFIDSGANGHMSKRNDWMVNYRETDDNVKVANSDTIKAAGAGDVSVKLKSSGELKVINEVSYVPGLSDNLLSVSAMCTKGMVALFSDTGCKMFRKEGFEYDGKVVATATNHDGLYKLDLSNDEVNDPEVAEQQVSVPEITQQTVFSVNHNKINLQELWHKRLGHLNGRSMNLLKNGMVVGVKYSNDTWKPCLPCIKGKQHRVPFKKSGARRAQEKLELIHADLCGPMSEPAWDGSKYFFVLVDDFTRKIFVYFLQSKDETKAKFAEFKAMVENETKLKIQTVRTDGGTEFLNQEMRSLLTDAGIKHQVTVPDSPQQNGVAERTNRTLVEIGRTLLQDSGLGAKYWVEVTRTAAYLKNRSPSKAVIGMTPEEAWTGEKPDLSHLRTFGCKVMVHVPKKFRKKWDSKSKECLFVGYCTETKGYRCVDPQNPRRVFRARDVIFLEETQEVGIKSEIPKNEVEPSVGLVMGNELVQDNEVMSVSSEGSGNDEIGQSESSDLETESESGESHGVDLDVGLGLERNEPNVGARRTKRVRKPKQFPDFVAYNVFESQTELGEPETVTQALLGKDKGKWKIAMEDELKSLSTNGAWELVHRPKGAHVIKSKWVFKIKRGPDGAVERYKARLVAKGFSQIEGIDYKETFSPVVRYSTIRMLLGVAVNLNLDIDHLDVSTAFQHGELEEVVYMEVPEGLNIQGEKVCLLKKALYGLKQASRAWNTKIHNILIKLGFSRSNLEPCVYFKSSNEGIIIIALYVDDFIVFSNNPSYKTELKTCLAREFKIRDLGELKHCLGMEFQRDKVTGEIRVNQKQYIQNVLERFNMSDCNPVSTPLDPSMKLDVSTSETNVDVPYQHLIGCIMYLAVCTRPDIAFVASYLSQFNVAHSDDHWKAAKRVLRYLQGTKDYHLSFKPTGNKIYGYVDADFANDVSDRKSYTGFVFMLGGGPVSWESKKQRIVTKHSTEAEYVALSEAGDEAVYLKNLFQELFGKSDTIVLFNDNQSSQKIAMNTGAGGRTKYIDVRYHRIRQHIEQNTLELNHVSTEEMVADVLTKGLGKIKHNKCVEGLGLIK